MGKGEISTYIPLQPPYKIIKHGNNIGVQVGTQVITVLGDSKHGNEAHNYPVVAKENNITPKEQAISINNSDIEIWSNIETRDVSVIGTLGVELSWSDFIEVLWHDHARLGNLTERIQKYLIYNKLLNYYGRQELAPLGMHTIHLHTEPSGTTPQVVRSAKDDVFALNVKWSDDLMVLEQELVNDLLGYLPIIAPNHSAHGWRLFYETEEDQLRPLVERLNKNEKATLFKNVLMGTFTIRALRPYKKDAGQSPNNPPSPPKKKGRAKALPFEDYIKSDAPEGLLSVLEEMLDGKTGKPAFTILLAITGLWINEPSIQSVCNKFPSVRRTAYHTAKCQHFGLNEYIDKKEPIPENKLLSIREEIKERLQNRDKKS